MSPPQSEEQVGVRKGKRMSSKLNESSRRIGSLEKNGNGSHHFDQLDDEDLGDSFVDSYVANHEERSFCGGVNLDGEEGKTCFYLQMQNPQQKDPC